VEHTVDALLEYGTAVVPYIFKDDISISERSTPGAQSTAGLKWNYTHSLL
jgi:hypothetical protein